MLYEILIKFRIHKELIQTECCCSIKVYIINSGNVSPATNMEPVDIYYVQCCSISENIIFHSENSP
jgi:hypothetical protein